MKNLFFGILFMTLMMSTAIANQPILGQPVDLTGKYAIKVDISMGVDDLSPTKSGIQNTDVMIYIADNANTTYDPAQIGTTIYRVDFRVDPSTGSFIYQLMNKAVESKSPVHVEGIMEADSIVRGLYVTDWPN